MPIRLDLAARLSAVAVPSVDTSDWVTGVWWPVKLRGAATSDDTGVQGVVLRVDAPTPDLLWLFIDDLSPLTPQYGELTIKVWQKLIARTQGALARGELLSPAPDMIVYGRPSPFRYPNAEVALQRIWGRQVVFMRAAEVKPESVGGTGPRDLPTTVNFVLEQLRAAFGCAMAVEEKDGMTRIEAKGRILGMVDARQMSDDKLRVLRRAGLALTMHEPNQPVRLQIISERAIELHAALDDLLVVLAGRGIETDVLPAHLAGSGAMAWLAAVNE